MSAVGQKRHLTDDQLAERWHCSTKKLQRMRVAGTGPKYIRVGRTLLYSEDEVEAEEARRTFQHSAAEAVAQHAA